MRSILLLVMSLFTLNANAAGSIGSSIAPPEYMGFVRLKGDLGYNSKNYKNIKKAVGSLGAHMICNDQFDGARAAEYDDFKYIINDLPGFEYWVIDAYTSKKFVSGSTYKLLRKDGTVVTIYDEFDGSCDSFMDDSSSYEATVLNASTGGLEMFSCDTEAYLACVK